MPSISYMAQGSKDWRLFLFRKKWEVPKKHYRWNTFFLWVTHLKSPLKELNLWPGFFGPPPKIHMNSTPSQPRKNLRGQFQHRYFLFLQFFVPCSVGCLPPKSHFFWALEKTTLIRWKLLFFELADCGKRNQFPQMYGETVGCLVDVVKWINITIKSWNRYSRMVPNMLQIIFSLKNSFIFTTKMWSKSEKIAHQLVRLDFRPDFFGVEHLGSQKLRFL